MASIAAQVTALQTMTVEQLQACWKEVFGEETRQRHRQHLIKRLARQLQDDRPPLTAEEEAKVERYREFLKGLPPERWFPGARHNRKKQPTSPPKRRALKPGTTISKMYRGEEHVVRVREDGRLDYAGATYRSLSAIAAAITGTIWSGPRFFFGDSRGGRR
ncbi:MAG: DUF2924 domain-containing protein [Krumholzibacteria bacterium]|nr:DUF2924 domain-containing protein [Candidatus Krumholzibacteria bacterium]